MRIIVQGIPLGVLPQLAQLLNRYGLPIVPDPSSSPPTPQPLEPDTEPKRRNSRAASKPRATKSRSRSTTD